jgi:hypothetical protein
MPPTPYTTHALPGPDVGGVGGRAPACRHAAADERGDVERQVGLDRTAEYWWISPNWLNVPSMHIAP